MAGTPRARAASARPAAVSAGSASTAPLSPPPSEALCRPGASSQMSRTAPERTTAAHSGPIAVAYSRTMPAVVLSPAMWIAHASALIQKPLIHASSAAPEGVTAQMSTVSETTASAFSSKARRGAPGSWPSPPAMSVGARSAKARPAWSRWSGSVTSTQSMPSSSASARWSPSAPKALASSCPVAPTGGAHSGEPPRTGSTSTHRSSTSMSRVGPPNGVILQSKSCFHRVSMGPPVSAFVVPARRWPRDRTRRERTRRPRPRRHVARQRGEGTAEPWPAPSA